MIYIIDVQNDANYPVAIPRLQQAAVVALSHGDSVAGSALTVVLVDNDAITALNRQYRAVDAPTDVLSFPADAPPVEVPGEPPYLGDVILAYPYAVEQAQREGHDPGDSLALLVVHGALHLLGYDHDSVENRATMWAAQAAILRTLQIAPEIVPALEEVR